MCVRVCTCVFVCACACVGACVQADEECVVYALMCEDARRLPPLPASETLRVFSSINMNEIEDSEGKIYVPYIGTLL